MWQPVTVSGTHLMHHERTMTLGLVKIWIWEWAKRSLWLLIVRCAWDPPLYRLCVVLCTICRSTWGPTGSAFTRGSEPDNRLLALPCDSRSLFQGHIWCTMREQWHWVCQDLDLGMGQKKFVATCSQVCLRPSLCTDCVLCFVPYAGSTWGPTGSAFTSGSEPDTDCLLYHVTAGHCFRDTFDAPWENNDIGSVKIWIWEWAKRSLWLLVVRCAWDPPLYRLCVVLCTICRSTWGPTGSAFTSGIWTRHRLLALPCGSRSLFQGHIWCTMREQWHWVCQDLDLGMGQKKFVATCSQVCLRPSLVPTVCCALYHMPVDLGADRVCFH